MKNLPWRYLSTSAGTKTVSKRFAVSRGPYEKRSWFSSLAFCYLDIAEDWEPPQQAEVILRAVD